MQISDEKLKELLVGPGHMSEVDFSAAAKEAEKIHAPLLEYLVKNGVIADEHLGRIIADGYDYHFVDLKKVNINDEMLAFIPEIVARAQKALVFEQTAENSLKLATAHPDNYEFIKFLEKKTGFLVEVYYSSPTGIEEALRHYKSNLGNQVKELIGKLETDVLNEQNIVKLVNLFLEYAYDNRASDIHIEPLEDDVSVRFRIDGVLHEVSSYPKSLHEKIVFRLKIMSRLRTDEHAAAQDGRFDYDMNDIRFDVRVSILPVTGGENVVMRLLSRQSQRLSFENLGLTGASLQKVKNAADKPYGMIISVGPTGSGKTTTLYAILHILNSPEVNIMTIEDPVEYDVERVQQTQVNEKKDLTFATGLRSIVRQDPDIIMVGEIRDAETADIAVNAAMTGHLVLSTLHANDAATTFPRLIEMDIEPFLVASSVNVIVAQRLVRQICERCRMSYYLSEEELALVRADHAFAAALGKVAGKEDISKVNFYKGAGCKVCGQTGYTGRTGIFEVLEITSEIRPLITEKASADVIERKAKELGMSSMLEDGLAKVLEGITTVAEVMRVTKSS
jgi:type IV pilus assembly protein PilB